MGYYCPQNRKIHEKSLKVYQRQRERERKIVVVVELEIIVELLHINVTR